MMEIREANKEDNDALLELQKKCPMGVNFVVAVDTSPDYFVRSQPYPDWHVFVATENQQIHGSAACTIRNMLVQGKPVRAAFAYGMMVDPDKRGKGIASQLQKHIENYAAKQKADLCHLLVMEGNVPSIKLCQKMGFEQIKDCTYFSLMVYKHEQLQSEPNIKTMDETDVENVVSMMNGTYQDYDFYCPYDKESFQAHIKKLPHFNQEDIYLFQEGKDTKACLGYWDQDKTRREKVQKMNLRLKAVSLPVKFLGLFTKMPRIPKTGETLKQWHLFPIACKDAASLEQLIKHVNNIALKNDITMLATAVDSQSPLAGVLSKFRHVKVKTHYFVKPIRKMRTPLLKERKFYIDIADV
jgi:ribosomal protein S18 acetylase RimI-like enzyme